MQMLLVQTLARYNHRSTLQIDDICVLPQLNYIANFLMPTPLSSEALITSTLPLQCKRILAFALQRRERDMTLLSVHTWCERVLCLFSLVTSWVGVFTFWSLIRSSGAIMYNKESCSRRIDISCLSKERQLISRKVSRGCDEPEYRCWAQEVLKLRWE